MSQMEWEEAYSHKMIVGSMIFDEMVYVLVFVSHSPV